MSKRLFPTSYTMFDPPYGADLPIEQYFVVLFDCLPSKYEDDSSHYDPEVKKHIESLGFTEEVKHYNNNKRKEPSSKSLWLNKEKRIMIVVSGAVNKTKNNLERLEFFYDIKYKGDIGEQFNFDELTTFVREKKKSNINLVKSEMGHMDVEEFDLFVPQMDLELNYGNHFLNVHDVIVNRLNEHHGKGIILLHGDPGTGKTSYIKYLTTLIKDKEILFVPPSMAEMISDPSIIPFLMEHKNSILIIEDAERVISDRETNGSSAGVSNILNLTDGILGDCLSIQIIATFNMKREKIDQALLRKGRLIAEHKFEKLNVKETNKLLKHLKKDVEITESMSLADIYNVEVELHKTKKGSKKIGF
jgi:hypothetical protein